MHTSYWILEHVPLMAQLAEQWTVVGSLDFGAKIPNIFQLSVFSHLIPSHFS